MPSKLETICYIYEYSERMTKDYTLNEMTAVTKMDKKDPKIIAYLRVKAFIFLDDLAEYNIHPFETGDIVYLKEKFIRFLNCSFETNGRTSPTPKSTNTRKPKKGRQTLSQMEATSTDLTTDLTVTLNANPLPPNFLTSSSKSNNNTLLEV
ncbi:15685_t:CDS:2 [Funneliformis caledonium]|uniref:15685_t:CDS:1 n=1 Tax=Funneliformis caledonium TaxID=1117310 RepID=A0A9N8VJJ5_9GLOM|nr:15685_t:CDS:2 [Funneliformis caledonium]